MSVDVATGLQPNIDLFRKYGFSDKKIMKLLSNYGEMFGHEPKRLEEILVKVDKELGIPPKSPPFVYAVLLLCSLSEKTLEAKYEIFKSFGWTDSDIKIMIRKSPRCLKLSETIIRERLKYFMNELGFKAGYLANRPYVMSYSMKDRVVPRYTILKVLKDRKLFTGELSVLTAVCSSESAFLDKFVLPYKDELPELCTAYICREKATSWNMRNFE